MFGFSLFLLVVFSCKNETTKENSKYHYFSDPSKKSNLTGEKLSLENELYYPFRIKIINSDLIISDLKSPDGILRVFDLNNKYEKFSHLPFGNDPYSIYGIDRIFVTGKNNNEISAFDSQAQKLLFLNLDSLSHSSTKFIYEYKKPLNTKNKHYLSVRNIIGINESNYVGEVYNQMGKPFAIFNENLETKKFFGDYPDILNKFGIDSVRFNLQVKHPIFSSHIHFDSGKNKLIVAYENFDLIEVYNLKTYEKEIIIVGPSAIRFPISEYLLLKSKIAVPPLEQKMGYGTIQSTNNGFLVLSNNKLAKDQDRWMTNEIMYFNWEGKAIERIKLNTEVVDFDIDIANNLIYGVSFEKENPAIYRFPYNFK